MSGQPGWAFWIGYPDLVRPRERFVELPSLGDPTPDELDWRRQLRRSPMLEKHAAALRAMTLEQWLGRLKGDDLSWALRAVRYLKWILARREERIVLRALDQGWGWDEIGAVLGVSRQAVAKRFTPIADAADAARRRPGGTDDSSDDPSALPRSPCS